MKSITYGLLTVLLFLTVSHSVFAQEEDPYSDYAHMWEDSKKKKKKKKKNKRDNVQEVQSIDSLQLPSDSLQIQNIDSLDTPNDSIQSESNTAEEPITPEENIDEAGEDSPQNEDEIPDETIASESEEDTVEDETPQDAPEEEKEEPVKPKEKREIAPIPPDFRSGMASSEESTVNAGVTYTQIGGKHYVGMTIQPELKFWKIGLGLNIPILYGLDDQSFRTEIFEGGVGPARVITYLRYGAQKQDPVYVKVGQLDGTMIGFGGLINNYTNSTSFEKRKLGVHYDLNFRGMVGIEGMYSDFDPSSKNLLATRPYVRPLSFLPVPIIRTLEFGATFVSDEDQTEIAISDSTSTTYNYTPGGVGGFGLDGGITLLNVPFIQIDAFYTWSRLSLIDGGLQSSLDTLSVSGETLADGYEDGKGSSYGINFRFNFIADVFNTDVRIERLSFTEHYVPQFFNTNYELNKDARIWSSTNAVAQSGIYGSITGQVLQTLRIGGNLLIPDEISEEAPAQVQVHANIDRLADKFSLNALYFKGDLATLSDAFSFDERSVAKVRFIYHMNKFLGVGLDYYWAFAPTGDGGIEATKYVSPYFGLSVQF